MRAEPWVMQGVIQADSRRTCEGWQWSCSEVGARCQTGCCLEEVYEPGKEDKGRTEVKEKGGFALAIASYLQQKLVAKATHSHQVDSSFQSVCLSLAPLL